MKNLSFVVTLFLSVNASAQVSMIDVGPLEVLELPVVRNFEKELESCLENISEYLLISEHFETGVACYADQLDGLVPLDIVNGGDETILDLKSVGIDLPYRVALTALPGFYGIAIEAPEQTPEKLKELFTQAMKGLQALAPQVRVFQPAGYINPENQEHRYYYEIVHFFSRKATIKGRKFLESFRVADISEHSVPKIVSEVKINDDQKNEISISSTELEDQSKEFSIRFSYDMKTKEKEIRATYFSEKLATMKKRQVRRMLKQKINEVAKRNFLKARTVTLEETTIRGEHEKATHGLTEKKGPRARVVQLAVSVENEVCLSQLEKGSIVGEMECSVYYASPVPISRDTLVLDRTWPDVKAQDGYVSIYPDIEGNRFGYNISYFVSKEVQEAPGYQAPSIDEVKTRIRAALKEYFAIEENRIVKSYIVLPEGSY